ncbi:MAG: ABC transporter ATP-binding protein [Erysipelotrichaceae bacterium]|jgi:energy-coupling factor transport system ATP-binding protein|nr:ABC transporter ATP-binding protein [Erysipelotrichaceae bacterium]
MEPIISFKDFSFQYNAQKQPTLKHIDLDIYPGEKILICGASGSGKSTLGNCINGLIPFSLNGKMEGELTVDGIRTRDSSIFELSTRVGTVLQDPDGQFVGLTVAEDIAFALENDCVPQEEMNRQILEAAKKVSIESRLQNAPYDLSGGQKQRVSMAGVIVDDVKILLFDEPLANLDPATGKSAIELIDVIKKQTDTTVIIIEHRIEDVLWEKVDRIILMNDGMIVSDSRPEELLCSDLLNEYGIREPLYLTQLKYAGIDVKKVKGIDNIKELELKDEDKKLIRDWYAKQDKPVRVNENRYILEVGHVDFSYVENEQILFDISFRIREGEMLAIVGKNGAGKSTLCKVVCGFEKNSRGKILFDGKDITDDSIRSRASHIGYVMQNPNQMISQAMIFDEVAMGIQNSGLSKEQIQERVYETLKICGLYEFRNWPISALSFGQKKRVTIASILVMGPEIIMLDEPTAGQDLRHYTEIMEFLKELNSKGITIIMITHDMHLMLEYTDRSIVFTDGRVIADESGSAVLCDRELVERAALKETSLFRIATEAGIDDPVDFVDCFIEQDRKERSHGH